MCKIHLIPLHFQGTAHQKPGFQAQALALENEAEKSPEALDSVVLMSYILFGIEKLKTAQIELGFWGSVIYSFYFEISKLCFFGVQ